MRRQGIPRDAAFLGKITSNLISIHFRTGSGLSLLIPCSGFLQFPATSASHFQVGSQLCTFDFVALGWLASFPAPQSQWERIPPVLRPWWQGPHSIRGRLWGKLIQGHCGRGTWRRGRAAHAHHNPPGVWQQCALNLRHWV